MNLESIVTNNKIQIYFQFYQVEELNEEFDENRIDEVGKYEVEYNKNISEYEMTKKCIDVCNDNLPQYLERVGIRKFIPYAECSFDVVDDHLEICYYFSQPLHCLISRQKYMPEVCADELGYLYDHYNLDGWTDNRIIAAQVDFDFAQ